MQTVEYALDGLAKRGEVRANNLANANTPGYKAGSVDFETNLRASLESGTAPRETAMPATTRAQNFPNGKSNTVSYEDEMVQMTKDNLSNKVLSRVYNHKASLLRTAMRGQ